MRHISCRRLQKVAEVDEIVSYLCADFQEAIAVTGVKSGVEGTHRAEELAILQAAEKHWRTEWYQ